MYLWQSDKCVAWTQLKSAMRTRKLAVTSTCFQSSSAKVTNGGGASWFRVKSKWSSHCTDELKNRDFELHIQFIKARIWSNRFVGNLGWLRCRLPGCYAHNVVWLYMSVKATHLIWKGSFALQHLCDGKGLTEMHITWLLDPTEQQHMYCNYQVTGLWQLAMYHNCYSHTAWSCR